MDFHVMPKTDRYVEQKIKKKKKKEGKVGKVGSE